MHTLALPRPETLLNLFGGSVGVWVRPLTNLRIDTRKRFLRADYNKSHQLLEGFAKAVVPKLAMLRCTCAASSSSRNPLLHKPSCEPPYMERSLVAAPLLVTQSGYHPSLQSQTAFSIGQTTIPRSVIRRLSICTETLYCVSPAGDARTLANAPSE